MRWLLSSRLEVDLLAELKDPGTNSSDASRSLVELDTQRLQDPVNAFIDHKLMKLKYKEGYDDRVLDEVSHEVRQRAENTFLWVALVFKELSSVEGCDAVETVQCIPPGLTNLYGHMMARIDGGNERNRQRCKNVLAATFLVHRPLSLSELVVVAGLPAKIKPRTVVDRCGSFLRECAGTGTHVDVRYGQQSRQPLRRTGPTQRRRGHVQAGTPRLREGPGTGVRRYVHSGSKYNPKPRCAIYAVA